MNPEQERLEVYRRIVDQTKPVPYDCEHEMVWRKLDWEGNLECVQCGKRLNFAQPAVSAQASCDHHFLYDGRNKWLTCTRCGAVIMARAPVRWWKRVRQAFRDWYWRW